MPLKCLDKSVVGSWEEKLAVRSLAVLPAWDPRVVRKHNLSGCHHQGPRPASPSCGLERLSQADTMPLTSSSGCLPVPPSSRWIPLFLPPSVTLCSSWEGLRDSPELW